MDLSEVDSNRANERWALGRLRCQVARQRCAGEQHASQTECLLLCRFYGASGEDYIHRRGCKPSDGAPHATAA
jgi:hypothetical protein